MNKLHNRADSANEPVVTSRREFLRKSAYAVYATPVIAALLIEKASAATSAAATCRQVYNGKYVNKADCCDVDKEKNTPPGDLNGCEIYF